MIYVCAWSHTLDTARCLVSDISEVHRHPITQIKKLQPSGEVIAFYLRFISVYTCVFTNAIVSILAAEHPINA